jgi:hypothetical protein
MMPATVSLGDRSRLRRESSGGPNIAMTTCSATAPNRNRLQAL